MNPLRQFKGFCEARLTLHGQESAEAVADGLFKVFGSEGLGREHQGRDPCISRLLFPIGDTIIGCALTR